MKYYGIPEKIVRMIKLLYEDTECTVSDGGKESAWFKIKTGVKQGCDLSGLLFLLVIDWIMRQGQENGRSGIRWKINNKLDDIDFADDIALVSSSFQQMDDKTKKLVTYASRTGLKINAKKTNLMRINNKEQRPIEVNGINIEDVEEFTYLGATVSTKGGGTEDISASGKTKQRQTNISKTE